MSELFTDIGWKSVNHEGEQLCGDHVELVRNRNEQVAVLADGLGSGVKASILSTLTSRIIATMMSQGMPLEECVSAVISALPVDAQKGVAYSTFTVIRVSDGREAEIIQYDNPQTILLRNGSLYELPVEKIIMENRELTRSRVLLKEGDVFIAMSDGCTNASAVSKYSYNWERKDIADYVKVFAQVGYNAKTLAAMLVDECDRRYNSQPLDDVTACVVRMKARKQINVLFGPPTDPNRDQEVLEDFFKAPGVHVVCGGTTAKMVGKYLNKPVKALNAVAASDHHVPSDIPPMSEIEGVDLVTEGIITFARVVEYVEDHAGENLRFPEWNDGKDGACRLTRLLLEDGTDICFYVGEAVNLNNQMDKMTAGLHLKKRAVEQLSKHLEAAGKWVSAAYY